jgi:putative ABC transport system permease protein
VKASFLLRMAAREARTGWQRLLFFLLSIAVGVGALVGIASFSANLEGAIRREARTLMAGDLEVVSSQEFDAQARDAVAAWDDEGARTVELAELPSMAASADGTRTQLVEIKAVAGDYPFLWRPRARARAPAGGADRGRQGGRRGGAAAAARRGGR